MDELDPHIIEVDLARHWRGVEPTDQEIAEVGTWLSIHPIEVFQDNDRTVLVHGLKRLRSFQRHNKNIAVVFGSSTPEARAAELLNEHTKAPTIPRSAEAHAVSVSVAALGLRQTARKLGRTEEYVRQQTHLAGLHPALLEQLDRGELTVAQARRLPRDHSAQLRRAGHPRRRRLPLQLVRAWIRAGLKRRDPGSERVARALAVAFGLRSYSELDDNDKQDLISATDPEIRQLQLPAVNGPNRRTPTAFALSPTTSCSATGCDRGEA